MDLILFGVERQEIKPGMSTGEIHFGDWSHRKGFEHLKFEGFFKINASIQY